MAAYNLTSLLQRGYDWKIKISDEETISRPTTREIPVRIPKIQRDYAEGREITSIERKRANMINDMLDVVYDSNKSLSLDFVYGYIICGDEILNGDLWQKMDGNNNYIYTNLFFDPLDGQQRLTTLFLLHWLFGRNKDIRNNKSGHSLFVYETRYTSEEFCHWLVNQDATDLIPKWQEKKNKIKKQNDENEKKWESEKNEAGIVDKFANRLKNPLQKVPSLLEYMQELDSFKWDWHDDPNIRSMIVVLESTIRYILERSKTYAEAVANKANLDNITFMLLSDLNCDGDRLFEKMNARGKALTSFEILKSSLEEEMELQQLSASDPGLINNWSKNIDGDWIDFCWDTSNIGANPKLNTIRGVENKLERLLLRMAAKSFFKTTITGNYKEGTDEINYSERLSKSIAENNKHTTVIDCYLDYARHERSQKNGNFAKLDFRTIFDDIDHLLYKDGGKWHDASEMLPKWNRKNDRRLLGEFLEDNPTHNIRVMVYAMLAYLDIVPASSIYNNPIEKENFKDWMRFIRNVYNSDNKTAGLDNFNDVKVAVDDIDYWLDEYKKNYSHGKPQEILKLIKNYIKVNTKSQEKERIEEEAIKADLRINGTPGVSGADWEMSIFRAEDNFYLWGQIIAPLSWSETATAYDKKAFDQYVDYLNRMFSNSVPDNERVDALLVQTMLCLSDYRLNAKNNLGSLARMNNHRDYSWKRYLRDYDKQSKQYGKLFKDIIDQWKQQPSWTFEAFLKNELSSRKAKFNIHDWQYYIVNISDPQTLLDIFNKVKTNGRYVFTEPGNHAFYFRSDTQRTSIRYELITTYLYFETQPRCHGIEAVELSDTVNGAYVDFKNAAGDIYRISLADGGKYNIEYQLVGSAVFSTLQADIDVASLETELKNLMIITGL